MNFNLFKIFCLFSKIKFLNRNKSKTLLKNKQEIYFIKQNIFILKNKVFDLFNFDFIFFKIYKNKKIKLFFFRYF